MPSDPDLQPSIAGWYALPFQSQGRQSFLPSASFGGQRMRILGPCVLWILAGTLSGEPNGRLSSGCRLQGGISNALQIGIVRTQSTLFLDQERQIVQVENEYGVQDCKPSLTPMEPHEVRWRAARFNPHTYHAGYGVFGSFPHPLRTCSLSV